MENRKVVLVTGCSSGFGRMMAMALPEKGYSVYAAMREIASRNQAVKAELEAEARKNNYDLRILDMDVTDNQSVSAAVARIIATSGRIDVLINNAGIMNNGITEAFTVAQVQEQFDVNFLGCVRTCRAVIPHMRRQKAGLIIQVSSLAGRAVFPFFGVYCASKFAVEALAEAYHYELKRFGINSIIVEPGPFATGLFNASPKPQDDSVLSEYGDLVKMSMQQLNAFESAAQDKDALGPGEVVKTIIRLIQMPDEDRPLRTIVSKYDFNISAINADTNKLQKSILEAIGLADLVRKRSDPACI